MRPGRNDPCDCGSGRKFKRCCGAPAPSGPVSLPEATDASFHLDVPPDIPTVVNGDGHLTVFTTSFYEVFDPEGLMFEIEYWRPKPHFDVQHDSSRRLESFQAEYERKPLGSRKAGERALVATLLWEGGPLVVESNSTERDLEIRERLLKLGPRFLRLERTLGRSVADVLSDPPPHNENRERESADLEVQARLTEMMRKMSLDWCDTAIPALGTRRPRTLVKTAAGRAKVLALVAQGESRPLPEGAAGMDFELIRRELGLDPAR